MLAKRIIPCLDVTNGRVVKGTNFVGLRDAGDPVELAIRYNQEGADELVFLDITATSDDRQVLLDVIERTAKCVHIPLTVGGGIKNIATMRELLNVGTDKISLNSSAVRTPELVQAASEQFGAQCIVIAVDAKRVNLPHMTWEVVINGGRIHTGLDVIEWVKKMAAYGAGEILLTSMDQDGTKAGYDLALTQAVAQAVSIPVIASGGAGTLGHISDALKVCDAALLASLLHYRELSIAKIKAHCKAQGLPIR